MQSRLLSSVRAAFDATAQQHATTIGGGVALQETVPTLAANDTGLVGTGKHHHWDAIFV